MAAVKQQVLNWLYSVLTSEYRDVNRTYNDVAQALSHYSSLSPRTDVYTYENGSSALLLQLSGTLPVTFRGTTYRFPIALWVPHGYPHEAPLVYVTPTEGMVVRPGQHVDPQGKLYHPYLVGWAEYWDKSNILDFLAVMRSVFAKEPPVISRQQPAVPPRPAASATPPSIPPLPPGLNRSSSVTANSDDRSQPPPPPPKPGSSNTQIYSSPGPARQESGPPLPPLPPQNLRSGQLGQSVNDYTQAPRRSSSLRYESAPPLPQTQRVQALQGTAYGPNPMTPPSLSGESHQQLPYNHPSQISHHTMSPPHQSQQQIPPSYIERIPHPNQPPQWQQQPPRPQPKPAPLPDLLDAPLTLTIPSPQAVAAPPVPPNPEKDMLLHSIGLALSTARQNTRNQAISSLPGLSSQHTAMLTSLSAMQSEIHELENLTSLLNTNTDILHTALRDADGVIKSSQHRTAPNVDEILVAPTVVGNQLYELVCEERSLGDALFVLGRALEKGRISPAVFAKMTRSLAREWHLKKALVKKISKGMGLAVY